MTISTYHKGIWYYNHLNTNPLLPNNWNQSDIPDTGNDPKVFKWNSCAMSGSGQFQLATSSQNGLMYYSTNYGQNWLPVPPTYS